MSFFNKKKRNRIKSAAVNTEMIKAIKEAKLKPTETKEKDIKQEKTPPEKVRNYKKEFLNLFGRLTYTHNQWDVWNDFIVMSACAISNAIDKTHYDEREKRYLKIIKKYTKTEQNIFPELLSVFVLALDENTEQDFLGDIYMSLGLANKNNGQHFTPYHVCELMADTTMSDILKQVKEKGYITINDPCCGAGATLIAGINKAKKELEKENLNFQNHIFVAAQDIDETVALMCYLQISLLGVAGYVKVGNALTEPMTEKDNTKNYWMTPMNMYYSDIWNLRQLFNSM